MPRRDYDAAHPEGNVNVPAVQAELLVGIEVSKSSHLFWALLSGNLPNRYWHLKN